MKKLVAFSILGAVSVAAAAQSGAGMGAVTISAAHQGFSLPARTYRILPEDLLVYRGSYVLSNGKLLHLTSMGPRLYAELAHEGPQELVAATASTFVARNGQMDLTFSPPTGKVSGVTLRVVDSSHANNAAPGQLITLAALH